MQENATSRTMTPTGDPPATRKPILTQAQKQALIDNLQLEITERARKLRAQYMLHAQGLRSRLEMRINRIPQGLRSANIQDLISKYSDRVSAAKVAGNATPSAASSELENAPPRPKITTVLSDSSVPSRGMKRPSTEMSTASDKENADVAINLPKKRAKTAAATISAPINAANTRSTRTGSRKVHPSQVLSPKSHNSRTLPRPPIKQANSATNTLTSRPGSPLKPLPPLPPTSPAAHAVQTAPTRTKAATAAAAARATTRLAATARTTRAAARPRAAAEPAERKTSNGSSTSNASAGTTVVTRGRPTKGATAAVPAKRGIAGKVVGATAAAGRKAAAVVTRRDGNAAAAAAGQASGGRVLRTRK